MAKIARFTDLATILRHEDALKTYLFEALEVEKAGNQGLKNACH